MRSRKPHAAGDETLIMGDSNTLEARMMLLISLQNCDTRIRDILARKKEGPLKIQGLEEELNRVEKQLQEELSERDEHRRKRKALDQEIDDLEIKIEKSNHKLSNIKSNKEYQAALKEIDDLQREKSLLEDKALEFMEEAESIDERCRAFQTESIASNEQCEKDRQEILKELEGLDLNLRSLREKRASLSKAVDGELLKRYDLLRERKNGLAVSAVRGGVCQACHMGIPPQRYNELIRGEALLNCPNCKRIIYWGENERLVASDQKD